MALARNAMGVLLATCLLLAGGVVASRPCQSAERADWTQALSAAVPTEGFETYIVEHHGDCVATCNDDDGDSQHELNTECWGSYVLFCKGNHSVMATKCEGHHLGIHVPDRHMYVAVCEGLLKRYARYTATCPKTGASKSYFFAKGCLGSSSAVIQKLSGHDDDDDDDDDTDLVPLTVSEMVALESRVPSVPEMDGLAAQLKDATNGALWNVLSGNATGGSWEARCKGRGGEVFGVKYGTHQDDDDEDVAASPAAAFDRLEAFALSGLGVPPELQLGEAAEHSSAAAHSSLASMVSLASDNYASSSRPSCTVTCNGKTPWFKGYLPCYGNLEVSCATEALPGRKSMSFDASCKGLWTGSLGKMCWGLTLQHSDRSWATGSAEMDGICSGKTGIFSKKRGDAFAMGQWCRGGSVGHIKVAKHADDDDDNEATVA